MPLDLDALETPEEWIGALRLSRDLREAGRLLSPKQQRLLVDLYYQIQDNRKATANQLRAAHEEPNAWITFLTSFMQRMEKLAAGGLDIASNQQAVSLWAKSIFGIGPVIAAGLAAYIDITRTPSVSGLWSLCGLNPTAVWEKGSKRPWNAQLKVLCVLPDQRVTTRRGHIPMQSVMVGDEVLTHTGQWKPVTDVYVNAYTGPAFQLRAYGRANQGAWVTAGHPVYTRERAVIYYVDTATGRARWKRGDQRRARRIARAQQMRDLREQGLTLRAIADICGVSEACVSVNVRYLANVLGQRPVGWRAVEDVEVGWDIFAPVISAHPQDVVLDFSNRAGLLYQGETVRSAGNRAKAVPVCVRVDTTVARLIGLYLAEGHSSLRKQVIWSFHIKERPYQTFVQESLQQIWGLSTSVYDNEAGQSTQVTCSSTLLADAFAEWFGTGAHSKHMPTAWLEILGDEEAMALIDGLMEGDGYTSPEGARTLTTVSQTLAYQVQELARRLGFLASINRHQDVYKVRLQARTITAEWTPTGTWHAVQSRRTRFYEGPVYNLEVADDHSYTVEGTIWHNCWKIGDSFMKFHNNPNCFYGHIYAARKQLEVERNAAFLFRDQAEKTLANRRIQDKATRAIYEAGQLPAGRLELRARRVAVKLFLSHYWEVAFYEHYHTLPRSPYILAKEPGLHRHYVPPPGYETIFVVSPDQRG
jgi:LAGLIDADG-like domain